MTAAKTFWMISGTGCGATTVRHGTYEAAEAEAKRLARSNPGVEFVILEAKKSFQKNEFDTVDYDAPSKQAGNPFDELIIDIIKGESKRPDTPFRVFFDGVPRGGFTRSFGRGGIV
jgi:hypothetical protein